MTRERIEDMREVVLPFVKKRLLETNYEGLGEADAKEFEREFNEILNLAIKALEREPCGDCISRTEAIKCLECDFDITGKENMKTVVNYINSAHNKIVNLPSVLPDVDDNNVGELTIHCKDCKFFEYDHFENVFGVQLIVAHEVCTKWGEACKTDENGACFLAERKEAADET